MSLYKVGDKVTIVNKRTEGMNFSGAMDKWLGKTMTISKYSGTGQIKMLEDHGGWAWTRAMISGLAKNKEEKVEVHQDFEKWLDEIKNHWVSEKSYKAFALVCINQMGFGHSLENSNNHSVTDKYRELSTDIQLNKEKYTRAIVNGYTLKKEKLYMIKLPGLQRNGKDIFVMKNGSDIEVDWSPIDYILNESPAPYQFTEKEIKDIDKNYWEFAKEVTK